MDIQRTRQEEDAVAADDAAWEATHAQQYRALKPGDRVFVTRPHDGMTGMTGLILPADSRWGLAPDVIPVQFDLGGSIFGYRPEDLQLVRLLSTLKLHEVSLGTDSVFPDARLTSVAQSENVAHMDTKPEMPVVDTTRREIARDVAVLFLDRHGKKQQAIQLAAGHSRCELMDGDDLIAVVPAQPGYEGRIPWMVQIPQEAVIQLTPSDEGLAAVLMEPRESVPDELVDDVLNVVEADGDVPAALLEAIKLKLREDPSWRPEDEGAREMTETVLRELCGEERHAMADGPHGAVCLREKHDGSHEWTIVTHPPKVEPQPLKTVRDDGPWSEAHELREQAVERAFNLEMANRAVPSTIEGRRERYLPAPPLRSLEPEQIQMIQQRAEAVLADARRAIVQLEQLVAEFTLQAKP